MNKQRQHKYYIECKRPCKGYVYFPDDNFDNQSDTENASNDDDEPQESKSIKDNLNKSMRDYSKQEFVRIDEKPSELNDPQYTQDKPQPTTFEKIMSSKTMKKIILFIRSHPFIPGLIILIIQAAIEVLAIFDLYTDVVVMLQLRESKNPILFGISAGFIAAPFVIAWTVGSHIVLLRYEKAHRRHRWQRLWTIFIALYDVAPVGIVMIFMFEVYHWIETIIVIPVFWTITGGLRHRKQGYQELGYYKLRKVSEVFAETLPQAVFQSFILLGVFGSTTCDKCTVSAVIQSIITSLLVLILWCAMLYFEAKKNGLSFGEYVAVTFQGSFDFVPMLPAIEKGVNEKGEFVNWSNFKIKKESFGQISKTVYSKQCQLKTLKMSQYTISQLNRLSCTFLGSRLKILSIRNNLEIIISRDEQQLHDFFNKYDTDKSESFDFIEFVKIYLSVHSAVKERSIITDIYEIWFKIVDKHSGQIWMLDLMLMANTATEYMPLIDYRSPLLHAYQTNNINLITFLMAANYHLTNDKNRIEFQICVKRAILENEIKLAAALCENIGVPIVVQLKSASNLEYAHHDDDNKYDDSENMNPFASIYILGKELKSSICRETNNPIWNDTVLFIIDFEIVNDLLQDFMDSKFKLRSNIDFLQSKSFKELDEMELRKYADASYQKVKKRRKLLHKNKGSVRYDAIDDSSQNDEKTQSEDIDPSPSSLLSASDYAFPEYLQTSKDNIDKPESMLKRNESFSLMLGRKLQRQPSDFEKYILQKEQGCLIVTFAVYSKSYDDNEEEDDEETDESKERNEIQDRYIGKENVIINLKKDLSKYGEEIKTYKLKHSLKKGGNLIDCGNISCKIHLNMLQMYHDAVAKCIENPLFYKNPMALIIDQDMFYRRDV